MTDTDLPSPDRSEAAQSLSSVLGDSQQVNEMVKESAEELSNVNRTLKQEFAAQDLPSEIGVTLERSEAIESKVQEASEKLTAVNEALKVEISERGLVEEQLAEAIAQEQAARYAAVHDSVTGLPNRVLFNDRLEHGIAQAKRHGWTLAVLFIDLDKFKEVNDTHGHDAGDVVLKTIAQRLKDNARDDDTVSRYGGDEFLCLLTELEQEKDVAMIAEKIIAAIQMPCTLDNVSGNPVCRVGASIGIAIYPKHGTTGDALIKSADQAMYDAKKNGLGYALAPST